MSVGLRNSLQLIICDLEFGRREKAINLHSKVEPFLSQRCRSIGPAFIAIGNFYGSHLVILSAPRVLSRRLAERSEAARY